MAKFEFFECSNRECDTTVLRLTGGTTPVCCGEEMLLLEAGTKDAAQEKHVPHVVREGNHLDVVVGEVVHPMEEKHYIAFIAVVQGDRFDIVNLEKTAEPRATFEVEDGPVEVYEYCNLHGLWKAEA